MTGAAGLAREHAAVLGGKDGQRRGVGLVGVSLRILQLSHLPHFFLEVGLFKTIELRGRVKLLYSLHRYTVESILVTRMWNT